MLATWVPALNVRETEDRFEVTVDLPGMEPEDINRLPRTANTEEIEATFEKGGPRASVPKTEAAEPRTIEVTPT